ncbi:magnesium chelatase subunit D [Sphingomonas sp. PAMC 26617]|uniref:magnesium chelatase subunit D n=1 Tax=Sphingomonas sp. PAMC 26617 TaxID=1112216 RepID=UPI000287CE9F|nr:magnesium chelatase subunit D [Sphingomonas sp. PAMC 26617]
MTDAPSALDDALLAARLCAMDPVGLGGMILRGGGDMRDDVVAALHPALPDGAPLRRIPAHVDDEALLGGLDLGATLALGRPVRQLGLLAAADGGLVVLPMAERMTDATAARLAGVLDAGVVDGAAVRVAVVALDDGVEDEAPPQALVERLAFRMDLSGCRPTSASPAKAGAQSRDNSGEGMRLVTTTCATGPRPSPGKDAVCLSPLPQDSQMPEERLGAEIPTSDPFAILAATALALGIDSARAPLFALRAARAAAALAGRDAIADEDLLLAVRLVLVPRATRLPAPPEADSAREPPPLPPESDSGEEEQGTLEAPEDVILEAALATLPRDVLEQLAAGRGRRSANRARGAGERRKSALRGRPLASRAGLPRGGVRLSLIDTLRAAAPWQTLRARGDGAIRIRRDDLRIRRFETRSETLTIFAVDASGSAAAARLAEAKGAVELLLAEAYVKRAQVALIAFRGVGAELLLPPTRSLTRARRALAALPGGGGTPLAAGLDAARLLAEAARARGRTPFLVVLTDGRANIAADGSAVRDRAEQDAEQAARAIGQTGISAAFVDTSARPRPEGARLALAMGARYLPLPRADATAMHRAVAAVQAA